MGRLSEGNAQNWLERRLIADYAYSSPIIQNGLGGSKGQRGRMAGLLLSWGGFASWDRGNLFPAWGMGSRTQSTRLMHPVRGVMIKRALADALAMPSRTVKQSGRFHHLALVPKKEIGASERHQQPPFRDAKFCPAHAVQVGFHVPPKVNGRRPGTSFDLPTKA